MSNNETSVHSKDDSSKQAVKVKFQEVLNIRHFVNFRMLYLTPMFAFLAIISFFDNGLVLGNNLQMQVSRMMEDLLDLREYFADLQKDIVNLRRDLNQDRVEKQTLIGKINETIYRCPNEYVDGRQKKLSNSDVDQKVVKSSLLSYDGLKKYDMLLKGLAKEKDIRINFGKKLEAVEERYGLRLSDLATKIGYITEHTEKGLNVKISANEVAFGIKLEAKVRTVELKLKENISTLNQTINNIYTQIEKWRLEQEDM
ncbi:hypothetical protein CHS0354_021907 [Potamilus streckersoni]|uniref:Uncharacterized protein n=1 Tax=Potamilus streckersoni TaxID=2493646 RepID=A0AAE0SKF1_9BIVA|nr:hypothetical protein CHS0354_021907 [Potamilus streckersoni]